jgi:type VI secretion system secreted protein Hcp
MRTKGQAVGLALRWPLTMAVIAIAVLVAAFNWPAQSAPASPTDVSGVTGALPGQPPDGGPAKAVPVADPGVAGDTFLKLDGIEGESADNQHKGELDIQSWSWGVTGGASVVGKPKFTDLTFAAATSKASPPLMLACAQGKHLKQAILTVRKAGEARQEVLKITLTDVVVTSFQQSGAGGAQLSEQFSFSYAQIVMEYRTQKADGSLGEVIKSGWDVKRNRPL